MSLLEVLLSLGLLATALLALLSVCVTAMHTTRKSLDSSIGASVAQRELDRAIYAALSDNPPGSRQEFWDMDFPSPSTTWSRGHTQVGPTELSYAIYAQTVLSASTGQPLGLGGTGSARVKKVDIVVWWSGQANHGRSGQGRSEACATRLVSESDVR